MDCLLLSKLKMWTRFTTNEIKKDKQVKDCKKSINVTEEYQGALRSKSFTDFFSKAQILVHDPSLSMARSYCNHKFFLEPDQETIAMVLDSNTVSKNSDMKDLILDYFDISSEASKICTKLLKSIIQIQSSYVTIQQNLDTVVEDFLPQPDGITYSKLFNYPITHNNPFSNISKQDFEVICSKHSSALQKMKVKRRKVARKLKLISCVNKGSGICVTAACGVVVVTAMALAAHTLTALIMGPVILSLPLKPLKKKLRNLQFLKSRFLRTVGNQLDVAMKGTYILNRDFDTMSRLVNRLNDDIERNRRMTELCLERGRGEDKICLQVLKELEKSDVWFRKLVEELEEHIYLCLLTINKARALVIKELLKSFNETFDR